MKSLLHCLWTGPSFPYSLRRYIKNWVQHFRKSKSEFELVLWLTEDSLRAFEDYIARGCVHRYNRADWQRRFAGIDAEFNNASLNGLSFYIGRLEPLFTKFPDVLTSIFRILHEHKRYTSVSNIGRLLVLNACGGIYSDIDYLTPNYSQRFPKNLRIIMTIFQRISRIGFYIDLKAVDNTILAENQCLILSGDELGALTPIITKIATKGATLVDKISIEAQNHMDFLENERAIALNSSLFKSDLETELMQAFKFRDARMFNAVNGEIFKDERFKSEAYNYDTAELESNRPLLTEGTLHNSYLITSKLTFEMVVEYFHKNLSRGYTQSCLVFMYRTFHDLFDCKQIMQQYNFTDPITGQHTGMFSWANPGFSRLTNLEKLSLDLEQRYITQKKLLEKKILLDLISGASTVSFGLLESRGSVHSRRCRLQLLEGFFRSLNKNYIPLKMAREGLASLLVIALVREGVGSHTNMGEYLVRKLSELRFKSFKDLIDPDKVKISYEDLENYILCNQELGHRELQQ